MILSNTSKDWAKDRPFQRINSPSFDGGDPPTSRKTRPDGDGHRRGCRRPEDFLNRSVLDALVRNKLLRMVPSWVTVEGNIEGNAEAENEKEVYGKLGRCFQTWTDAPPIPWHLWYDWNFYIEPEEPFKHLCGLGNHEAEEGELAPIELSFWERHFTSKIGGRNQNVSPGLNIECEWDTGAFGREQRPGPMFQPRTDAQHDWAWPMTGDYVWIRGRWIYDGGHEAKESSGRLTCRAELHPCKAIASARWEAFKFKENDKFVPAIQFMFFTSRFGGYHDFASINPATGGDYEFIVDLPEVPIDGPPSVAIGHSPGFPSNTIVFRKPELLVDFNFKPFLNTCKGNQPFSSPDSPPEAFKPKVELLEPSGPNPRQRQVKVTIPIGDIANQNADFYGVIVSLGWSDNGEQAQKVKKCTFRFENLFKGAQDHDTFQEEWRFKAGVNGRWRQWEFEDVSNNTDLDLQQQHPGYIVFYLHEDDAIRISSHGAELDLVDNVYTENSDDARTIKIHPAEVEWESRVALPAIPPFDVIGATGDIITGRLSGTPIDWNTHVDVRPPADAVPPSTVASYPVQRTVVRKIFSLMWTTLNDQNEPLGLIDPGRGPDKELNSNPLYIRNLQRRTTHRRNLTAYFTWEVEDLAELLERPHKTDADANNEDFIDYVLTYSIQIEDQ